MAVLSFFYQYHSFHHKALYYIEKTLIIDSKNEKYYNFAAKICIDIFLNTSDIKFIQKANEYFSKANKINSSENNKKKYINTEKYLKKWKDKEFKELKIYL